MSRGKYSPFIPKHVGDRDWDHFKFNASKELPPAYKDGEYDEAVHFANYDSEGYDWYGYSAFNRDGKYVGIGMGIDRNGYSEDDYLTMSEEEWDDVR